MAYIIKPLVTEKMTAITEKQNNQFGFIVRPDANKIEIRNAVEEIFDVKVQKVFTMNMKGKRVRRGYTVGKKPDWKKAIVKLTDDSKTIEFFEGV